MNFLSWCGVSYGGNDIFNVIILLGVFFYFIFVLLVYKKILSIMKKRQISFWKKILISFIYFIISYLFYIIIKIISWSLIIPLEEDPLRWGLPVIHSYSTMRFYYLFRYIMMIICLLAILSFLYFGYVSKKIINKKKYRKRIVLSFIIGTFIYISVVIGAYIHIDNIAEDYDIIYHDCGNGKHRADHE